MHTLQVLSANRKWIKLQHQATGTSAVAFALSILQCRERQGLASVQQWYAEVTAKEAEADLALTALLLSVQATAIWRCSACRSAVACCSMLALALLQSTCRTHSVVQQQAQRIQAQQIPNNRCVQLLS